MDVTIINPFLKAAIRLFQNMFAIEITPGIPYVLEEEISHRWEISGILGLTGGYQGLVAFRLPRLLADKLLEKSGISTTSEEEREDTVYGMVGELTNIISGNAISEIKHTSISISPPVVVYGEHHQIAWPKTIPVIGIPFTSISGAFEVDVCFKRNRKALGVKDSITVFFVCFLYTLGMHYFTKGSSLRVVHFLFPIGFFLIPLFVALLQKWDCKEIFGFKKGLFREYIYGIILIVGVFLLTQELAEFVKPIMPNKYYASLFLRDQIKTKTGYAFIVFVVFPAFFEEVLFRGFILSGLKNELKPQIAILLCAFLFALLHLDLYKFLFAFIPGLAMGWVMIKSRCIWIPIIMHFFHNLFPFISVLFPIRQKILTMLGNFGGHCFYVLFGSCFVFYGAIKFYKIKKPKEIARSTVV